MAEVGNRKSGYVIIRLIGEMAVPEWKRLLMGLKVLFVVLLTETLTEVTYVS